MLGQDGGNVWKMAIDTTINVNFDGGNRWN